MTVAILYNRLADDASAADRDVLTQVQSVGDALGRLGRRAAIVPCDLNLAAVQQQLRRLPPSLVFNLVESLGGSDALMFLATALLDQMGVPYTGSPTEAIFLTNNKLLAKQRLVQAGLPTPPWISAAGPVGGARADAIGAPRSAFVSHPEGAERDLSQTPGELAATVCPGARFIIKAVAEHASIGLDEDALAEAAEADVQRRMREFRRRHGRPCFAELFIDGREFNLSLLADRAGCRVLPPAEIDFAAFPEGRPRLVGYRAKWQADSFEYRNTPRTFDFAAADRRLLDQLADLASACWDLFGLRGYARVDFRVDSAGQPWILEVNANPCLSPDAGFAAALAQARIPYHEAIADILAASGGGRSDGAGSAAVEDLAVVEDGAVPAAMRC